MPRMGKMGGHHQRYMPTAKPKDTKNTLIRLMKLYTKWKHSISFAMLFTVLTTAISLTLPYLIGQAVNNFDAVLGTVNKSAVLSIITILVFCYISHVIVEMISGYIMANVSQKLVKHIRADFFSKLQRLPLGFYDTHPNGDTMSRLTNDSDNISNTIAQTTTQLLSSVLSIFGSVVMMLLLSSLLTPVAFVSIPLVFVLTKSIASKSKKYFLLQQRSLGALNGTIEENIVGFKMVKAFNRKEEVLAEFEKENRALAGFSTLAQTWSGFLMPFMNVINNLSFALIATCGGIMAVKNMISIGVVVSFLTYSKQFAMPLNNIASMFNTIQSALAGAERVFEILDEAEELCDNENAVELNKIRGKVEFKNVGFSYVPDKPVLNDVSFLAESGSVIALVGETGAGKTTIVNLLTRFYELSDGEILIDDINITNIKRQSLRSLFSVVLQETCLFSGTIADNIKYSNPNASMDEVVNAAKLAHAHGFISILPQKYETRVSGSTDSLSLGQRQLIAIARAILCNSKILILDEATSSVDTKTEKDIQKALLTLMKNKTSFLIAHRLSTIKDADKIMVIGDGKIKESGTHAELMLQKGDYHNMVVSQTGEPGRFLFS